MKWHHKWPVLLCFILFLINQILQKYNLSFSFTRNYLDDLLCMPVILGFCLTCLQLIKKDPDFQLDWWYIAVTVLYISIVFEVFTPKNFTSDPWDVLCYVIGSLIFKGFMNR